MNNELKIFSGNSNPGLSDAICKYLNTKLSGARVGQFADGECRVKIHENVRGTDCFVIQSTSPPVNQNLMEVLIMIDSLKRASAKRITAVIPYFGYGRQDRKESPRVPITAKLVANLFQSAGIDRMLVMDIHTPQIQGFFDCPVDNLLPFPVLIKYLEKNKIDSLTIVAPDPGGVGRARELGKKMEAPLVVVDKRRLEPNVSKVYHIVGDVRDRNTLILDDIIDTGGTISEVSAALKEDGAKSVYVAATHGLFSGDAVSKLEESKINQILITDTINIPSEKQIPNIKILSVANLLGEAIKRIHEETSVSDLFI